MFCANCSKLAILVTNKKCIRCNAIVLNNISVICESCSGFQKQCSVCLKKINGDLRKQGYRGCSRCGSK